MKIAIKHKFVKALQSYLYYIWFCIIITSHRCQSFDCMRVCCRQARARWRRLPCKGGFVFCYKKIEEQFYNKSINILKSLFGQEVWFEILHTDIVFFEFEDFPSSCRNEINSTRYFVNYTQAKNDYMFFGWMIKLSVEGKV